MVTLTEIAADKVRAFITQQAEAGKGVGLRGGGRGGGCISRLQDVYAVNEVRHEDHVFDHQGIRLLVASGSLRYVYSSQVDNTDSLLDSGFQV